MHNSTIAAVFALLYVAVTATAVVLEKNTISDIDVYRDETGRVISATLCVSAGTYEWLSITPLRFYLKAQDSGRFVVKEGQVINEGEVRGDLVNSQLLDGRESLDQDKLPDRQRVRCLGMKMHPGVALAGSYELLVKARHFPVWFSRRFWSQSFDVAPSIAIIEDYCRLSTGLNRAENVLAATEYVSRHYPGADVRVFLLDIQDGDVDAIYVKHNIADNVNVVFEKSKEIFLENITKLLSDFNFVFVSDPEAYSREFWDGHTVFPLRLLSRHNFGTSSENGIMFPDLTNFETATFENPDIRQIYASVDPEPYYMDMKLNEERFFSALLRLDKGPVINVVSTRGIDFERFPLQKFSRSPVTFERYGYDGDLQATVRSQPWTFKDEKEQTVAIRVVPKLSRADKITAMLRSGPIVGVGTDQDFLRALVTNKVPIHDESSEFIPSWAAFIASTPGVGEHSPLYGTARFGICQINHFFLENVQFGDLDRILNDLATVKRRLYNEANADQLLLPKMNKVIAKTNNSKFVPNTLKHLGRFWAATKEASQRAWDATKDSVKAYNDFRNGKW